MRNFLAFATRAIMLLLVAGLFTGCRSIEKMVESGQYDQAIELAARRLPGKTKKKQKIVSAVERALEKANRNDMGRIESLRARENPENWEYVYRIARRIERRQATLEPMLPLVDEYGYQADFSFIRIGVILEEAKNGAAEYLYQMAYQRLEEGREGNKLAAREAMSLFEEVESYRRHYKDLVKLKEAAYELGVTRVVIRLENQSPDYIPAYLQEELTTFHGNNMVSNWKEIDLYPQDEKSYDYKVTLRIEELYVSPEKVTEIRHKESRVITEKRFKKNKKGKIVRDSLGNKIEYIEELTVKATVIELVQDKFAELHGTLEVTDLRSGETVQMEPMHARFEFHNNACRVRGDKRAIKGKNYQIGQPLPFPTDSDMLVGAANQIKPEAIRHVRKNQYLI